MDRAGGIVVDGVICAGNRDPPGQSSIYIPPGDIRNESYRLSTFRKFPEHSPVLAIDLASSGFYYTGYKDRVKCFRCGIPVENWIVGDDPTDLKWHKTDCEFACKTDTLNVPLHSTGLLRRFRTEWLRYNSPSPPVEDPNVTSYVQFNRNRSPNLRGQDTRNGIANHRAASQNQHQSATVSWTENYPCLHPVNPHMKSTTVRIESFRTRNGIRWPQERLRASIHDLVNAGFYYIGERDRVKCWYCNGGLQNWDYDDDPWTEHAKWFPSCEYVLSIKGPTFVENITSQYPNINRPEPVRRSMVGGAQEGRDDNLVTSIRSLSNANIATAVENAMGHLSYVATGREMGFDVGLMKSILTRCTHCISVCLFAHTKTLYFAAFRRYQETGGFFSNSNDFFEEIFASEARSNLTENVTQSTAPNHTNQSSRRNENGSHHTNPPSCTSQRIGASTPRHQDHQQRNASNESNFSDMASQLRSLEESRLCRLCKKELCNIVFIPCGHLSTCENCAKGLRKCPVCNRSVHDTIKSFRS